MIDFIFQFELGIACVRIVYISSLKSWLKLNLFISWLNLDEVEFWAKYKLLDACK